MQKSMIFVQLISITSRLLVEFYADTKKITVGLLATSAQKAKEICPIVRTLREDQPLRII